MLLFDEPLSNLDARLRRQMREEIRDLQQRLVLTVVYVTHDQAEAMAVSDRIIVMNKAAIAQEGAPRELYEQPRDAFVAGFMGDANRVRGMLARRDATHGRRPLGALTLSLPHRGLARRRGRRRDPPRSDRAARGGCGALRGTVRKAAYLGGIDGVHARHADRRAVRGVAQPSRLRSRGATPWRSRWRATASWSFHPSPREAVMECSGATGLF